ncbi:MAG: M1 family metallopeptidase [Clostridia bacterium]|nr:M1 family metallopeptidase [Clostridia bacterium]
MKKLICIICCALFLPLFSSCKSEGEEGANYRLNLVLNEDMTVDGSMEYSFTAEFENQSYITFNLYPNAFSENATVSPVFERDIPSAYPNGFSGGKVDILTVKTNGKTADFEIGGVNSQFLKAKFSSPLKRGEKASVYVEFKCLLPNVNHRFGYGEDTVNLTGFYPIACVYENGEFIQNVYYPSGDPFYSECADYDVSLTVPSTYTVASSMAVEKTIWSGGQTEYVYKRDCVRDIAFVLSEKFNVLKGEANGVEVTYYYYSDSAPEKTLQTAVDAIDFFSSTYYEYPYGEYAVCQADFLYGGMEYPCLSLVSDAVGEYLDYTVAHETAHQWFYGIIGVNESEIGYLDEGLTELSTACFMDGREGKTYRDYILEAENSYEAIKSSLTYLGITTPPVMERNLKDFSSELEYVMIAYNRSEIAFDRVKSRLSDKLFFKTMKKFIKNNAFSNVTTSDLTKAFERAKRGTGEFLKGYVDGVTAI